LHADKRDWPDVPVFKLAKDHWYPTPPKLRQDFLGVGVRLYAICIPGATVMAFRRSSEGERVEEAAKRQGRTLGREPQLPAECE